MFHVQITLNILSFQFLSVYKPTVEQLFRLSWCEQILVLIEEEDGFFAVISSSGVKKQWQ